MSKKIDHIVYCVPNLNEAIELLENKLGVRAVVGGQHLSQGTKNALIYLGDEIYLEILAIDESNTTIDSPRWMGIDLVDTAKITRWAIKAEDINTDSRLLSEYQKDMGKVSGGSRKMTNGNTLTWQIAMPLESPEIEVVPFVTDWTKSKNHPTDSLDHQCKLLELRLNHPNPEEIQNLFIQMAIDIKIYKSTKPSIEIIIQCPNGTLQL